MLISMFQVLAMLHFFQSENTHCIILLVPYSFANKKLALMFNSNIPGRRCFKTFDIF